MASMKGTGAYWCACVQCHEAFFGGKYDLICPDCKASATKAVKTSKDGAPRPRGHRAFLNIGGAGK